MRHAPDKHGEHAREETNADGEIRLLVLDAAARAEVLLPPIVVGREREPLAPGAHCSVRMNDGHEDKVFINSQAFRVIAVSSLGDVNRIQEPDTTLNTRARGKSAFLSASGNTLASAQLKAQKAAKRCLCRI